MTLLWCTARSFMVWIESAKHVCVVGLSRQFYFETSHCVSEKMSDHELIGLIKVSYNGVKSVIDNLYRKMHLLDKRDP